MLTSKYYCQ